MVKLAEGVRFELTRQLPVYRFSRPALSATQPPLLKLKSGKGLILA